MGNLEQISDNYDENSSLKIVGLNIHALGTQPVQSVSAYTGTFT